MNRGQITLSKLEKLKKKHTNWDPTVITELTAAERDLRRAIATKKVAEMPIIKKILKGIKENVEEINTILLNDEKIGNDDRHVLFIKRRVFEMFLDPFGLADQAIEGVEALVDNENKDNG